jgi:hypothetical protein
VTEPTDSVAINNRANAVRYRVGRGNGKLTKDETLILVDDIKARVGSVTAHIDAIHDDVVVLYGKRGPEAVGASNWATFCEEYLGVNLPIKKDEKLDLMRALMSSGLTSRAVGAVIGVDQSTVVRNARPTDARASVAEAPTTKISLDGKTRPASRLTPPTIMAPAASGRPSTPPVQLATGSPGAQPTGPPPTTTRFIGAPPPALREPAAPAQPAPTRPAADTTTERATLTEYIRQIDRQAIWPILEYFQEYKMLISQLSDADLDDMTEALSLISADAMKLKTLIREYRD